MKKKLPIVLALITVFLMVPFVTNAESDREQSFKEDLKKAGYVPLDQAIAKFEDTYNVKVKVPNAPIESNYEVGNVSEKDKVLEMNFMKIDEVKSENFIVFVKKVDQSNKDLYAADKVKDKKITLKDGTVSYFKDLPNTYRLVFKKDGLEYCYMAKSKSDLTEKEFIAIADSFQ
ncbi:hypothetical protein ABEY43_25320 [Priestia megaterium]